MNCRRHINKLLEAFVTILGVFFVFISYASKANAADSYNSVTLVPSSGTIYGTDTAIAVNVDSGSNNGEGFKGIQLTLSFTGPVSYVKTVGASKCSNVDVSTSSGQIEVLCTYVSSTPESYSGTMFTVYFKATGSGTSTFTASSTGISVGTITGGVYTLSTEAAPTGGLPSSGLFDDSLTEVLVGAGFLVLGVVINMIPVKNFDFAGRIDNVKDKRLQRKREKWEDKF